MLFSKTYLLSALQFLGAAQALTAGYAPVRTHHNADEETTVAIKRALHAARGITHPLNKTALTKSWADATLFSLGTGSSSNSSVGSHDATTDLQAGIAVICKACYINGSVSGILTVEDDYNATEVVHSVKEEISNMTDSVIDQLKEFAADVVGNISESITDLPSWPTLDFDFDLDEVNGFPDTHARFEFNDLELYLELDVQLSAGATYTLNLFVSETPVGVSIAGLEAGALFKVSLVLIAEAEIDISSGIHVKLDDGLALDLELFNKNVSGITLPGGRMEFLPITIEGHGSLQALLQLEASVGFNVDSSTLLPDFTASAGISAEIFAYIADILLQVDASTDDDADCEFEAVAEYTLAVGAAAGATVAIDTYQWGPAPSTIIPVFYTTLASVCAGAKTATTPTTTPTAALEQRDDDSDLVTTTVSTSTTYTLVDCLSKGLVNCPPHLQTTTSVEETMSTVLTVASDVDATFPAKTFASVTSAIPFGENVRSLAATSGTPVSYVPPPATSPPATSSPGGDSDSGSVAAADEQHSSNNNKLIIGLSVGLGVPALIVLACGLWWFIHQRRNYSPVPPELAESAKQARTTVVAT